MAFTYGKTSFQDLINDLRLEINRDARLASLADEVIQKWLLEAEATITQETVVEEQWELGLNQYVTKYYFRDRPPITAVNTATPLQVTAAGHGLSTGDFIRIQGVVGEPNANGNFKVTVVDTSNFTIQRSFNVEGATNADPIVITAQNHGLSSGDQVTIASVLGNTAANGTHYVSVSNAKEFALYSDAGLTTGVEGNGTYTSGGTVAIDTSTSGTYSDGGWFWRDDELPTHMIDIGRWTRPWNGLTRGVKILSTDKFLDVQIWDGSYLKAYAANSETGVAVVITRGYDRFLEIYPEPTADQTCELYGVVRVNPQDFDDLDLDAQLHLPFQFDDLMKTYAESKIMKWLGDRNESKTLMNDFYGKLGLFKARQPQHTQMRVEYK